MQSQSTLPPGALHEQRALADGEAPARVPMPVSAGSSGLTALRWSRRSSSSVVHR